MPAISEGNVTVTYDSTELTDYCNTQDLQMAIDKLESTHFGSTGKEYVQGYGDYSIGLGGDFAMAIDDEFGADVIAGAGDKTTVITISDGTETVTYTWTTASSVENYNISAATGQLIQWTADLMLSGAPSRSVA